MWLAPYLSIYLREQILGITDEAKLAIEEMLIKK